MIIKELTLHNFGIYASTNTFYFHGEKPVVLIGGMNGRGKTTFLDAVLLSLYGANSFAYIESKYNSYGQYLKSFVNKSDGSLETYIEIEFVMDSSENEMYKVRRSWSAKRQRISETIKVYKDGSYNQFLTDNWSMFIENILPSGLSSFFFFDGEKIAELAVESTDKQMKESIKTLLGISVLDLLKADVGRVMNRTSKEQNNENNNESLEKLRIERDSAIKDLENIDLELANLENRKKDLEQSLEKKNQEYSLKGGDIVSQKSELIRQRNVASARMEAEKEILISDAASEIPLAMVKNLLSDIRAQSEIEKDKKTLELAVSKLQDLFIEYDGINKGDNEPLRRFMDYVCAKRDTLTSGETYKLDDAALLKLQILLDERLELTKSAISERINSISKLKDEINQLDSYMSVDIDEDELSKLYREIKETEQDIISTEVIISQKVEERKSINGKAISASSVFNHSVEDYLKKEEFKDESERVVKYAHMVNKILDEYTVRLQSKKIEIVANTMTECYRKLANKRNLIDHVTIDPATLDFQYIDTSGEVVDKVSLSAGEKQLMVISLLWSLAICSKKKLPVIIDTPLSRLDSIHRLSLIKTYFPNASDQTIILSTDEEIDRNYYEIMKDDVGDEYTLIYDDASKATTIHQGFFMEA